MVTGNGLVLSVVHAVGDPVLLTNQEHAHGYDVAEADHFGMAWRPVKCCGSLSQRGEDVGYE